MTDSEFTPANQLLPHTEQGVLKLHGYQPKPPPNPDMSRALRQLITEIIMSQHNTTGTPIHQAQIYRHVTERIPTLRSLGQWPWQTPGRLTVNRRVREAADPRFAEDGVPKVVCVTAGVYAVNPELMEDE